MLGDCRYSADGGAPTQHLRFCEQKRQFLPIIPTFSAHSRIFGRGEHREMTSMGYYCHEACRNNHTPRFASRRFLRGRQIAHGASENKYLIFAAPYGMINRTNIVNDAPVICVRRFFGGVTASVGFCRSDKAKEALSVCRTLAHGDENSRKKGGFG